MIDDYIIRAEHEEFVKRMEDEHQRMNKRLTVLEKSSDQMQELINNVGVMATNMRHMAEEQHDQSERLQRLENIPNQNWSTIKNSIFAAVGAAIGSAAIAALISFL